MLSGFIISCHNVDDQKRKEVLEVLQVNQGSNRMWSPDGVRNIGMEPTGVFKFSGVDAEPVHEWDSGAGRYNDNIVGWSYPVVQDWVDPSTGEVFRQNQIMVTIDSSHKLALKFGDEVRFDGLGGFYSRRSRHFRAHAEKIERVKKGEKDEKN